MSNIQEKYQRDFGRINCPQTLREKLTEEMYHASMAGQQTSGKESKLYAEQRCQKHYHRYRKALVPAAALLLCAGILLWGKDTLHALETLFSEGVSYSVFEAGNATATMAFFDLSEWNQDQTSAGSGAALAQWETYYPEFYSKLSEAQALEVLLPSFGLGEYEYRQGADYIGEMAPDDVFLSAEMWKGDSCYMFTISKLSNATAMAFANKMYSHYEIPVNGITYEVMQLPQDYTYEEYRAIQEILSEGAFEPLKNEAQFNEWKKRPVIVMTMVDDWQYGFTLSEDIDVTEFLEGIR